MDSVMQLLVKADEMLSRIAVKGDDTYAMVGARNTLKAAYDALARKEAAEDVSGE